LSKFSNYPIIGTKKASADVIGMEMGFRLFPTQKILPTPAELYVCIYLMPTAVYQRGFTITLSFGDVSEKMF